MSVCLARWRLRSTLPNKKPRDNMRLNKWHSILLSCDNRYDAGGAVDREDCGDTDLLLTG